MGEKNVTAEKRGVSRSTLVASVFAGAAVGAGMAMLCTPKKGSELRASITGFTGDAAGKVIDFTKAAQNKFMKAIEEGKVSLTDRKSLIAAAIEAGREAFKNGKPAV